MAGRTETSNMLTLFAKIVLSLAATSLLFLDDRSLDMITSASPRGLGTSLLSQVCLGVTFVAFVFLVAVWDCALAVLVCMFVVCWIAILKQRGVRQQQQQQRRIQEQKEQRTLLAESARVSYGQGYVIESQLDKDNDVRYMYSVDTPLPTENKQTSVPMAFTMGDRSYSTTVV